MSERAGLMARVSTAAQLDNTSPDEQLRRNREYCAQKGYEVVIERVEAISGAFVLARSVFREFLDLATDGKLEVIVFDIPDRAGRGDAIAKMELLATLHGARIEYARPGRDTSTLEGLALNATDQLVSGFERINIRRRTMDGRRALAGTGRVIATPYRPYGYDFVSQRDERGRKVSCKMVVVEDEARVVRMIFEWFAEEGLPMTQIARRLTEAGIHTMADKNPNFTKPKRKPGQWCLSTVSGILRNETYAGVWRYAKLEVTRHDAIGQIKKISRHRSRSETIAVQVPAIIPPELWAAVQERLSHNKRGRKPTILYLLRSRLRCARCGGAMCRYAKKRKDGTEKRYYRCHNTSPDIYLDQCRCRFVDALTLESVVWGCIAQALQDDARIDDELSARRAKAERARQLIEGALAGLEAQTRKARDRLNRLLDLYTGGDLEKGAYLAKRAEIEREVEKRNAERLELEDQLRKHRVLSPDEERELEDFRRRLAQGIEQATIEERMKLLEILQVQCIYDDQADEVTISGIIGRRTMNVTS